MEAERARSRSTRGRTGSRCSRRTGGRRRASRSSAPGARAGRRARDGRPAAARGSAAGERSSRSAWSRSPAAAATSTRREYDLFAYLAGQAAVSIENVDLHETVQRQAVTDELTGLYNLRHFHETLDAEVERARRFGTERRAGDARHRRLQARQRHLRPPAGRPRAERGRRACCATSRATSTSRPATAARRWRSIAARRRTSRAPSCSPSACARRIEALRIDRLDGDGTLQVTASFGVASLPRHARRQGRADRRPPTPRCTAPSAPARTGWAGRSLWSRRANLRRGDGSCSTTPSASTSSSSAGTAPIPTR